MNAYLTAPKNAARPPANEGRVAPSSAWRALVPVLLCSGGWLTTGAAQAQFAVVDVTANTTLTTINTTLGVTNTSLGTINTSLGTVNTSLGTINSTITTQFETLFTTYLTSIKADMTFLVAQGVLNPAMVTVVSTLMSAWVGATGTLMGLAAPGGVEAAVTAITAGAGFSALLLPTGTGCASDATVSGLNLTTLCSNLWALRAYRAVHSEAYQTMVLAVVAAIQAFQATPPVNIADVHVKNQGINTLHALQQQMAELYRAQQDYIQARIEISNSAYQALANQKRGKRPQDLASRALAAAEITAIKTAFRGARGAITRRDRWPD